MKLNLNNLHIIVSQIGKLSLLELGVYNIRNEYSYLILIKNHFCFYVVVI